MSVKKRKKKTRACAAFLLAMMLPFAAKADQVNLGLTYTAAPLGTASQSAAVVYGVDTTLTYTTQTLRQIGAVGDSLKVTGAISMTNTVNVLDAWTTPLYIPVSAPAYAATTTWLAVNVSTLAGASCGDCRLYWQTYNAAGMEWMVNRNHLLTPTAKFFTAVSVTATMDDGFTNGDVFTFRLPSGTADVYFLAKTRTAR